MKENKVGKEDRDIQGKENSMVTDSQPKKGLSTFRKQTKN